MPKMKTHKATAKRLKVTGGGKIMHKRPGGAHLLSGKTRRRKRRFKVLSAVKPADAKRFAKLIRPGGEL
ncbi:50S ribosomal protein L35 [bacterium]|nr:50S ribosomal protein L35 [bacterium]